MDIDEIIEDKIYLGGRTGASSEPVLQIMLIRGIVNLGEVSNNFPDSFVYKKIKLKDDEEEKIRDHFEEVFKFINETEGRVFVHCFGGVSRKNRSVSFVIAYLMKHKRMNLRDALNHVMKCRKGIRPNDGFMNQLIQYEVELIEEKILDSNTKRYSMEEYKLWCIKKILGSRSSKFSDDVILQALAENDGDVQVTCSKLFYE